MTPAQVGASRLTGLECGACGEPFPADEPRSVCEHEGRPLLARYALGGSAPPRSGSEAGGSDALVGSVPPLDRSMLAGRPTNLWRYAELLPIRDPANVVSLGEGWTPIVEVPRVAARLGVGAAHLLAKDEGRNPTGSFKARGMAVAVSRAKELGARTVATPSAGNAGAALAAYAARAGLAAVVAMPADAPASARAQVEAHGARLLLVDGLIGDAGRLIAGLSAARGWANLATLREPYRVEGKKTMGLELAEQLGWRLPDLVVYPTGGGTGIVGMWKAFAEMEQLGWIGPERPRFLSVQAAGCAPIVRAFERGELTAEPWADATTAAAGLRVPSAIGDGLILTAIRESGGAALAVEDAEMVAARSELATLEGLDVSLEAAATLAGYRRALELGLAARDETALLFLTGSGLLEPPPPAPPVGAPAAAPVFAPDDVEGAGAYLDATPATLA